MRIIFSENQIQAALKDAKNLTGKELNDLFDQLARSHRIDELVQIHTSHPSIHAKIVDYVNSNELKDQK